ncbi:Glutamyl-tRNA(Gln) amidotransferase subunit A (Glu-ADT subunit A) [Scheffersomyces stipitis CBS 6054]|uniref:Glutamyl-tRNA(Gln) amidotransferase subunit A (Glu-ADT subunit A) n=1 Tax=Scheffersomyces stipitis (strain ATCC 58785 / CBS 6054 / NBRC 10063 / NRRL Y-11545) TaxID=322104 RepID=A3LRC9_PICST|nr:Glutamyl-tRNA(Gln) amidotransferase subunit A (Glu-ADT subunit A) [Scheffersomyces stipitis CBS 6054]ABN65714.2 Glutamyl-tRNA(Gln) amidotransferase subunit A (Glu-ADT subunit A) [Scheffersomyces stipitis CBS 6054]
MKVQSLGVFVIASLVNGAAISSYSIRSTFDVLAESQALNDTTYNFAQTESAELFPMPECKGITLEEATIDQLQDYMAQGKLSSVDLVQCYLERYFQINDFVNGVLQLNPDMFSIASTLDNERKSGIVRGPLHGIPFLVKDNYATKDKMQTTCGSNALLGSVVPRDAHVVSKLREAGAVLFGHATLSEWADMRSNSYSEGYSAVGGQARCPYNLTLNGGGSSTGSGGSVAANLIMFALGTETDGSIISPAGNNGVVGFKPTVGLTSRAGVIPESEHQDTTGPFARTVRDAVYAFQYMYGVDARDNYTLAQVGKVPEDGDYLKFLSDKTALKGAKFGLPWAKLWSSADPEQVEGLLEAIKLIEEAGATVYNNTDFGNLDVISDDGWNWDFGSVNESEYTIVKVDFFNNIASYLSELENTKIRSLQDIVDYNYANDGTEGGNPGTHPAFESGQDGLLASLEWSGIKNETYYQAIEFVHRTSRDEGIDYALNYTDSGTGENFQLDGLLVPSGHSITYQQAAKAGYPMITIPVNETSVGLPYGLGIMQTAWAEPQLIKYGSAIEDLIQGRTKPKFLDYLAKNIPVV